MVAETDLADEMWELRSQLSRVTAERDLLADRGTLQALKDANDRAEKAEAERDGLAKERERLTSSPVDHRYWEGRYRTEAAENVRLVEINENITAERDAARAALKDWLAYAEEELHEFDIIEDDECSAERLCPKCESTGCIEIKIRNTRAALASTEGDLR